MIKPSLSRGVLRVVDVLDPLAMLFRRICRESERLGVALRKFFGELGGATHFGRADWREICRMAEKEHPAIASPFVETDRTVLGFGLEVWGDVANVKSHS